MRQSLGLCILWCLLVSAPLLSSAELAQSAEPAGFSAIDGGDAYKATFFDCNGTYQERYGVYWLASSNPFQFRRRFSAKWYFEGLPVQDLQGDELVLKLTFAVYTNSIESGGKPTAASISVNAQNPDSGQTYSVNTVRVEMNKDEVPIPTYVHVPKEIMTSDGRTIIEIRGAGQIGVSQERLVVILPSL